ncbi:MAG: ABC transporter permease [Halioglobus sp.]|nr:ABC transporter permease [Halioglobus sp.]
MSSTPPAYSLLAGNQGTYSLVLSGDWVQGQRNPNFAELTNSLDTTELTALAVDGSALGDWDSQLMAFLLRCHDYCLARDITFNSRNLPEGTDKLLAVATAVKPYHAPDKKRRAWLGNLNPTQLLSGISQEIRLSLGFIGDLTIAMAKLITGRSNTRLTDFRNFCYQAGPNAFGIISLTSILVGMILAYLGAVQLQQFGAEIYVANLVVIGMLREMGVLMTAVVMAGRTGAAYAAQLGTMQTNEEIDAIRTMGISPMEFLVVPRMLALIVIMPLLTIYADLLGIIGGGIVAAGMGIAPSQYMIQGETTLTITHVSVGLTKALVFAVLIAMAGCRAGMNSGRSSAAVGQAATNAVVTSIVYLIVADASINILFQQLNI